MNPHLLISEVSRETPIVEHKYVVIFGGATTVVAAARARAGFLAIGNAAAMNAPAGLAHAYTDARASYITSPCGRWSDTPLCPVRNSRHADI